MRRDGGADRGEEEESAESGWVGGPATGCEPSYTGVVGVVGAAKR